MIARCDGKPVIWPERTHAPADSPEVASGKCRPWRAAAEIIDWSLPCPSIFDTKQEIKKKYGIQAVRPLADNTQKRIARGLDKFVIKSGKPFIVPRGYGEREGQQPRVHDINEPLPTTVSSSKHYVCTPALVQVNHAGETLRGQDLRQPMPTVTAKNGLGVIASKLAPYHMHNHENATGTDIREPVNTVTGSGSQMLIAPALIQYHSEQSDYTRGQAIERPVMTVDASGRYALMAAHLTEYYGNAQDALPLSEPMHTQTAKDREALTVAHIAEFKGQDKGQPMQNPLRTITASAGEFGEVRTYLVKILPGIPLYRWPLVREMLNTYCGYSIAENEILILEIGGTAYFIADIGLRMLSARELYAAQGFPPDYIIDHDYTGKEYKKTAQVARCGNAVPPPFAEALVRANLPEMCGVKITSMEQLESLIAV